MDAIPAPEELHLPRGHDDERVFLEPMPITKDNLNVVVDAGWITKEALCAGRHRRLRRPCD
jgi:D-xylose transport system substrate-binding protein